MNDSSSLSTTLLWSGPENDIQTSIVAEGQLRGITVKVEHRKYSSAQLDRAAARIAAGGSHAIKGFTWSAVIAISPDFDGIRLRGVATATPVAASATGKKNTAAATTGKRTTAAIADDAADLGGVDVNVQTGVGIDLTATHRWDDTSAFNAGGLLTSPSTGGICSTGFSVKVNGTPYAMTARHCVEHDYRTLSGNHSYGDGVRNSSDGAARQLSAKGSGLMFDGAWNNSAGYRKTVIGYGDVSAGDRVCTSGANSGVHCGITVTALGVIIDDDYPFVSDSTFSAIAGDAGAGHAANCKGDSGGPVLAPRNDSDVLAVGMIQAFPTYSPWYLTTSERYPNNLCSQGVYFTSMRSIVRGLPNASLVTG